MGILHVFLILCYIPKYSKEAFQYLSFDILTFFFLVKLQHHIIMDMPPDMKKQLMQMAGITDVNEFDKMASTFAEKNQEFAKSTKDNAAQSGKKKKQSPFQVHFVKMLALIDVQGQSNFDCLNKDIEAQLKYVYEAIDCDVEYNDMFEFMKKYFQEANDMSSPAKVKEKAETSRLIRDRGNKALFEKT